MLYILLPLPNVKLLPKVRNYHQHLNPANLQAVLVELPPLLSESDLHIAQLTLNLLTSVARLQRGCLATVTATSLPHVLKLAQSPLLQGAALSAMLDFFQVTNQGQKRTRFTN